MQETQETRVWSLAWEDPLEEQATTRSSILTSKIPWAEEPGVLPSMGLQRVGHDWAHSKHTHTHTHRPQGVYANEVTLGGKRSGVWNVSSGPQEQGLLVKQVPRVWPGGGWGLVSKTLFFFLTIYFCFAESLCCTWAFSRFLMMLLSLQTMD